MKSLLCLILLLASTVMVFAPKQRAKPVTATWKLTYIGRNATYYWNGVDADIARFSYPSNYPADFPALLTRLQTTNLHGKTLNATVETITGGQPGYVFGGKFTGWNPGNTPPNVRLFFTTRTTVYDNDLSSLFPNDFWWSHDGVVQLDFLTGFGPYLLTADMNPSRWSNGTGGFGHNNPSAFSNAVKNVKQLGLSWGGGSFFDCGDSVTNGVPTTFRLISFSTQ